MWLSRHDEELTREPTIEEALADPVVQAVMARDRVSRDDLLRVVRAAQARLRPSRGHALSPGAFEGVVTPFPARAVRAAAHPSERRDIAVPAARRCRGGSPVED